MKHVVGLSGGKDSTAMALRLAEVEPRDYIYICTPTGDELPEMEKHWERLEGILGREIIRVSHPVFPNLLSLCRHKKALPNHWMRFCTGILKIEAANLFCESLEADVTAYIGLRADEETRLGNYDPSIRQEFPLREWGWGLSDVMAYLNKRGIKIPRRTDCARCFHQRIGEWWNLWKDYPEIFADAERWEAEFGATFVTPGKWKNWPHQLKDIRLEFEKGRVPRNADAYHPMFPDDDGGGPCRACSL